jgi:hypothetical protein
MFVIPALWRQRQKDQEFEGSEILSQKQTKPQQFRRRFQGLCAG